MKRLLLTLLLSVVTLAGCDYFVDPGAYNDKIIDIDDKAMEAYKAYDALYTATPLEGDIAALDAKREETIKTITALRAELALVEGLRGDTDLRDVILEDLDLMIKTLGTEEKELIELGKKMASSDEISPEDTDRENELIDAINANSDAMYEKASAAQEAFAAKYNYEIEPEKFQP